MQSTEAEVWKPVPGYGGRYLASSEGRIWSKAKNRVLSQSIAGQGGYLRVGMPTDRGGSTSGYVHRLVAMAFHGLPNRGEQARHLDGNPKNNRPSNLAWGDRIANDRDKLAHGTHSSQRTRCPNGHLYQDDTYQISSSGRRKAGRLCLICDRQGRARRKAPLVGGRRICPPEHKHGQSITCRNSHGCSCDPCVVAMRAYRRGVQ